MSIENGPARVLLIRRGGYGGVVHGWGAIYVLGVDFRTGFDESGGNGEMHVFGTVVVRR